MQDRANARAERGNMDNVNEQGPESQCKTRLRAMIEIVNGEVRVYPIASSDEEAEENPKPAFVGAQCIGRILIQTAKPQRKYFP